MPLVVGVSFRKVGKVYYFDPGEIELHEGDFVVAETARGIEFGEVVLEPREVSEEELVAPLKKVVRIATGQDLDREASNRDRERSAFEICERKITEHGLGMKLLEAECAFDGSQIIFSFSAEGRIDFRELVKDVAGALKTKVQLHQIGVRDEAKLVGGYGGCGRPLCCATFLSNFEPISMKMAKDQSLFLNPAKFSGCCGKLMCCLRYEHEHYKDSQRRLPAVGAILQLENGKARVVDVNVINNMLTLETEDEVQIHIKANQLKLEGICRKHGIACNMAEKNCQALVSDPSMLPDDIDDEDDELDMDIDPSLLDEAPRPPARDNRGQRPPQSRDRSQRPAGQGQNRQSQQGRPARPGRPEKSDKPDRQENDDRARRETDTDDSPIKGVVFRDLVSQQRPQPPTSRSQSGPGSEPKNGGNGSRGNGGGNGSENRGDSKPNQGDRGRRNRNFRNRGRSNKNPGSNS